MFAILISTTYISINIAFIRYGNRKTGPRGRSLL